MHDGDVARAMSRNTDACGGFSVPHRNDHRWDAGLDRLTWLVATPKACENESLRDTRSVVRPKRRDCEWLRLPTDVRVRVVVVELRTKARVESNQTSRGMHVLAVTRP